MNDEPRLPKMVVEREDVANSFTFHQHKGNAIGEADLLALVPVEIDDGFCFVLERWPKNLTFI